MRGFRSSAARSSVLLVALVEVDARTAEGTEVPFLDLGAMHRGLKAELLADFANLIDSGAFVNGPAVAAFEREFAAYCGLRECIGVASGLDALRFALLAGGIAPGEEVVVPAMTFVATLEAVTQAGGRPVVADVSDSDYALDPAAAAAALSRRTRFLMPVHLYGQMADMPALLALASRAGVAVVEDACQAHGAERAGRPPGHGSLAAAFSFYPGKNLGAMGDAGALVSEDPDIATRTRALREHGQRAKYEHGSEGYTGRLDSLQALVLLRKLRLLDGWNRERAVVAALYSAGLDGVGDLVLPRVAPGSAPVWHLYVVRTADPVALADFLAARGIATGRHYPEPVHLTGAYAYLGYRAGDFPVAEALAREGLSLPIFPGMTERQVEAVTAAVAGFFAAKR